MRPAGFSTTIPADFAGVGFRFGKALCGNADSKSLHCKPIGSRSKLHLNENDLLQDLRLLLANGDQIQGADTYRYAMKRIWWAYLDFLFSIAPLGRNIFNWSYRKFAMHRYQISRACKLSGKITR